MADVFGCLHDFVSVKETSLITTKTQASLPFPTGSGFVHGSAPSPTSEGDPISLSQPFSDVCPWDSSVASGRSKLFHTKPLFVFFTFILL